MKLSVIIPCYNFQDYIAQSILSALSQRTNFEFEILVRDDNSTDNSRESIKRLTGITMLDSSVNLGASRNIKMLLDHCKGEYVAYLDGDDYWTDIYKLQRQVDFMDNNPDCIMTFTGFWTKLDEGFIPNMLNAWLSLPDDYINNEITTENFLQRNPGTFGRVFRNTQGLVKDWMLDVDFFDWITNYELSKLGKIKYMNFPSGIYRYHGKGSLSSLSSDELSLKNHEIVTKIRKDYDQWKNFQVE